MNIQNINNNNISNKGIYYTKSAPLISKNIDFDSNVAYKVSKLGAKYIEDNSVQLNHNIKKNLSKRNILVDLAKKMDVFIQFFGEKWDNTFKTYESKLRLYLLKEENGKKELQIYDFAANDANSPIAARTKLFNNL